MGSIDWNTHITALIISTLLFIVGIMTGALLNREKISYLEETITSLSNTIQDVELQILFLDIAGDKISCEYLIGEANKLGDEAGRLGEKVELYEQNVKLEDTSYKQLKSTYMSILIRDWITLEKIKSSCAGNYTTVLFFYEQNSVACENQGAVLSYYKELLGNNIMVFALDYSLNHTTINGFVKAFNINRFPSIVVNMETYEGFKSSAEFKEIICSQGNYTICN
ncbi:MAG: hypothetical protein PHW96_03935 [Candidatus Nanoarchaeia archaeon]|nr:hypothetical protein [Candidatus Nanoarchaeia archaeon]